VLYDNNKVEAVMKCAMTNGQSIFDLNNDLVTSYHRVLYGLEDPKWIYVKDHPNSIERSLYSPEIVYCLNTTNKNIVTRMNKYLDWDDIIENNLNVEECSNDGIIKTQRGFHYNTLIISSYETLIPIYKIKIGDILYLDYEVIGIVLISRDNDTNTYITEKGIWDENVEDYMDIYDFHLITTSGMFYIFDNKIYQKVTDYSNTEYSK
jgi:hypothetical protein